MISPRVLCLWLPNWPIQRRLVAQPELDRERAILLVHLQRGARRIAACSLVARRAGVHVDMPLAEADALLRRAGQTSAICLPHEPEQDLQALQALARQCDELSPCVGWQCLTAFRRLEANPERDCLLLDVANLEVLFGGERRLLQTARRTLEQRGYYTRAAVADTVGAAWAAARHHASHQRPLVRIAPGRAAAALAKLPVECLRLSAELVRDLHRLGVRQVEQALELPRQLVPARLGESLLQRLDQALGDAAETIEPLRAESPWIMQRDLEPPALDWLCVLAVLDDLLHRLLAGLAAKQQGVIRLVGRFRDERGNTHALTAGLYRPSADPQHLRQLLRLQIEHQPAPAPIMRVALQVFAAPLIIRQQELFDQGRQQADEVAKLIDRLSSRLGRRRVLQARLTSDAQPERAWKWLPWTQAAALARRQRASVARAAAASSPPSTINSNNSQTAKDSPANPSTNTSHSHAGDALWTRPLWLLPTPRPLRAELDAQGRPLRLHDGDRTLQVAACWGPEQIETGWWRGPSVRRTYYRIQSRQGDTYWIYQDQTNQQWALQGVFG